jgi:branched-chain amino acid transport system substrate-binding protein
MKLSGRISLSLTAIILVLSGCKESAPLLKADEQLVKIGHAAPLTGTQAHIGKDNENGVRLAIEEANAAGISIGGKKIRFQLLSEDDQADPKNGTIVAHKLADAEINGMIGHLNSGTTIPASRVYHDAGIPQISPSATNPRYTQQGFKSAFRTMANDEQQGRLLGQFATRHLSAKRIAIIDDRTAYGQGLADEFEKSARSNGGVIVAREFTTDKSTDFRAILTSIKGNRPDLLFFGGMDPQGGPLMRQVRSLGITAQFLGGDGLYTPEFIKLAGDASEGAYSSLPGVPLEKMPNGLAFRDKYRAKYNRDIQLYAPFCYDAVNIMIEAMKRADSVKPEKYLPELIKTDYSGVTARIMFDERGDLKAGAITFYRVRNGKWEVAETLSSTPSKSSLTATQSDTKKPE